MPNYSVLRRWGKAALLRVEYRGGKLRRGECDLRPSNDSDQISACGGGCQDKPAVIWANKPDHHPLRRNYAIRGALYLLVQNSAVPFPRQSPHRRIVGDTARGRLITFLDGYRKPTGRSLTLQGYRRSLPPHVPCRTAKEQ